MPNPKKTATIDRNIAKWPAQIKTDLEIQDTGMKAMLGVEVKLTL